MIIAFFKTYCFYAVRAVRRVRRAWNTKSISIKDYTGVRDATENESQSKLTGVYA